MACLSKEFNESLELLIFAHCEEIYAVESKVSFVRWASAEVVFKDYQRWLVKANAIKEDAIDKKGINVVDSPNCGIIGA